MKRISASVVFLAMLPLTTALGQKVETKYDHSVDFHQYKTYAWKERRLLTRQGKQTEELIDHALVGAVNSQLRAKGLVEEQNGPDLYLNYDGSSTIGDSKAAAAYAPHDLRGYGAGNVWTSNAIPGSIPNVWVSMEGVLLFEAIDAKTGSVVWSSLLRKKIKNSSKTPEDFDKSASEIARKAFQGFPPKAGRK